MKKGKALYPATVSKGGKTFIDLKHSAAETWRLEYRVEDPDDVAREISDPGADTIVPASELEPEIRAYGEYTLNQIVSKFGTRAAFKDVLSSIDKIESIHQKRLASDKSTGELINRDYVRRHVLGLVERVFQHLQTSMPVKLGYEVHGMCQTGATVEEVKEVIQKAVSRELKAVKKDTQKAIKNASD